jgi:very-short-patch-repair endonuclease
MRHEFPHRRPSPEIDDAVHRGMREETHRRDSGRAGDEESRGVVALAARQHGVVTDSDLQARGYRVIRLTWRQIVREPERIVARVATLLAIP